MLRQGCENLRNTVKCRGRGPNHGTLPLRGKQAERPWQIFGFYSEREELPVSEEKRKEIQYNKKKKKRMDVLKQRQEQFYTLLKSYLGVVLTSPGLIKFFFFFFFFFSPLKTRGGARVKELSLK